MEDPNLTQHQSTEALAARVGEASTPALSKQHVPSCQAILQVLFFSVNIHFFNLLLTAAKFPPKEIFLPI